MHASMKLQVERDIQQHYLLFFIFMQISHKLAIITVYAMELFIQ